MHSNPNLEIEKLREICPENPSEQKPDDDKRVKDARRLARRKSFRPIILCFALFFGISALSAKLQTQMSLKVDYTDNLFQLSDFEKSAFNNNDAKYDYIKTKDDLSIGTQITMAYPLHYRWWKFTPSVTGKISQNISNPDKYRQDTILRMRVDRHYWSASAMYGYYPYIYYRHFTDTDGSGRLEKYSYQKNLYRADGIVRPVKNLSAFGNVRYEEKYYNKYFTEADGNVLTGEFGARYQLPTFSVQASYALSKFKAEGYKKLDLEDSSYESDIYRVVLKSVPLKLDNANKYRVQPRLELKFENRFFQGDNAKYGGRVYEYTNGKAGMDFTLGPAWNLSLDYLHIFRNVDSTSSNIIRTKEFSENRISAELKYKF